jgi:hypothetical protein
MKVLRVTGQLLGTRVSIALAHAFLLRVGRLGFGGVATEAGTLRGLVGVTLQALVLGRAVGHALLLRRGGIGSQGQADQQDSGQQERSFHRELQAVAGARSIGCRQQGHVKNRASAATACRHSDRRIT